MQTGRYDVVSVKLRVSRLIMMVTQPIDPLKQESSSGFDRIASGITSSLSGAMITKETPVLKDGNLILRET